MVDGGSSCAMDEDDCEDERFWAELGGAGRGGKATTGSALDGETPPSDPHRMVSPDTEGGQRLGGCVSGDGEGGAATVVLHVDVDSFYCEVERMDEPSLRGKPLAVQQFNSGGFVAVSYEARAAGVRKGDGVGAGGRANIAHLKEVGALSVEEARRRCPDLVLRPMRTERYRQVSLAVQQLLRRWAQGGEVERASYDDFYLRLNPHCPVVDRCCQAAAHVMGVRCVDDLPTYLQHATRAAQSIQSALRELGLSASVGVSASKLLSRLLSPINKPAAVTVLHPKAALPFLHAQPIRAIPGLQRKAGRHVVDALGVDTVAEIAKFSSAQLHAALAPSHAQLLLDLFHGDLRDTVKERGPPKSLAAERSCPPASDKSTIVGMLNLLSTNLAERLQQDAASFGRLPDKLTLGWRQGYGSGIRSRSTEFPTPQALPVLKHYKDGGDAASDDGDPRHASMKERLAEVLSAAALALLTRSVPPPWQLSRLVVGVAFSQTEQVATNAERESFSCFFRKYGSDKERGHTGDVPVSKGANGVGTQGTDAKAVKDEIDSGGDDVLPSITPLSNNTERETEVSAGNRGDETSCWLQSVDVAEQRHILASIAREQTRRDGNCSTNKRSASRGRGDGSDGKRGRTRSLGSRTKGSGEGIRMGAASSGGPQLSIKQLFERANSQLGRSDLCSHDSVRLRRMG